MNDIRLEMKEAKLDLAVFRRAERSYGCLTPRTIELSRGLRYDADYNAITQHHYSKPIAEHPRASIFATGHHKNLRPPRPPSRWRSQTATAPCHRHTEAYPARSALAATTRPPFWATTTSGTRPRWRAVISKRSLQNIELMIPFGIDAQTGRSSMFCSSHRPSSHRPSSWRIRREESWTW